MEEADKKDSIMPTSTEKDKDVAMGDADDIDMGDAADENASDRGAANAEVKAPPDADDFAPTPGMREIMVNFLVRMSFLTGESKDKQMLALHARSLSLLREALATWPSANIKFAFIEKLLASAAAAGGDAANTLRTGLAVFNVALDADAERFVSGNAPQLAQMLEPCFNSRSRATHEALANALARAMYPLPPPDAAPGERGVPPPETKLLQHRLDELCAKHVAAAVAGAAGAAATPNAQTPDTSVACVLTCISALAERNRAWWTATFRTRQAAVQAHARAEPSERRRGGASAARRRARRAADAARARVRLRRARHVAMRVSDRSRGSRGGAQAALPAHAPAAHQRPQHARRRAHGDAGRRQGLGGRRRRRRRAGRRRRRAAIPAGVAAAAKREPGTRRRPP